jgi:hypothetical protein
MNDHVQESRTEKVAVAVTPREKLAIQLVAARHGTDLSNLLRDRILAGVLEEAEEIRANFNRAGLSA